MKTVCVTSKDKKYSFLAKKCIASAKTLGILVEPYESVELPDLERVAAENGTFLKYKSSDSNNLTNFEERVCPIKRISNGLTHFLLYKWSAENKEPICILESDALVIGKFPNPIDTGVIQTSSHKMDQFSAYSLFHSGRSKKFREADPQGYKEWADKFNWDCCNQTGVIKHPLTGTHGTSGYVVGHLAAKRLVDYFTDDGIGFADRVREDHIGAGNLYLQNPQSVIVPRHGNHIVDGVKKHSFKIKLKRILKKNLLKNSIYSMAASTQNSLFQRGNKYP